jgi:cytochrome P450
MARGNTETGFRFDGAAFLTDPYPTYRRIREAGRAVALSLPGDPGQQMWLLTHYEDAASALREPRLTKDFYRFIPRENRPPEARTDGDLMLFADPPKHTRLRAVFHDAFTLRRVQELEGRIAAVADHLIERSLCSGAMDFVSDFALPLPVIVIAELIGVPVADRDRFRTWSRDIVATADGTRATDEALQRAGNATDALIEYFGGLIRDRRAAPKDDLLTALVAACDAGEISPEDLLANCRLLLIAGHETTVNLLANGLLALLRYPDEMARLRADRSLLPSAIEEMLRYDSPVQRGTFRMAAEPLTLAGRTFQPGEMVSAVIGAANRDPAQFPEPDRFDVGRTPNRHLAFGQGPHFCLGATLARMEARVAFARLLDTLPGSVRLAGEPVYAENTVVRGPRSLPVAF